jgi:hypothetical protein
MIPPLWVFAGPSLPAADRIEWPGVVYRTPAARDDITAAADEAGAILLIDGVFHHDLAPSPREVVDACDRVTMFGASSMGALRAAECRSFGMLGLGAIAGWYAHERIDGDDEVAVAMHPRTHVALSVPAVNVRYTARLAARRGILSASAAHTWAVRARTQIFYADRTWDAALALAPARHRAALAVIARAEGDLKRWDARFALRRAIRFLERAPAGV